MEKDLGSSGAEVIGGHEPTNMGSGSQIAGLPRELFILLPAEPSLLPQKTHTLFYHSSSFKANIDHILDETS